MKSVAPKPTPVDPPAETIAASYERVSTRAQGQTGFSLGAQAKDAAQFAAEHGWTLPEHLRFRDGEDRHASGADWHLPGLNAMLDAATAGKFRILIVPAVDRFARDRVKAGVLEQDLRKKYGVRVVYITAPVEDTAEGRLLVGQLQLFAEYEREKIAFRTMRGRREKIDRGLILGSGPPPYGYRYVRDHSFARPRTIGLEVDALIAPIVERIFRDALHKSALDIGEALGREGVPPPPGYNRRDPGKRWAPDVVIRILTHPVYAGRMVYGAGDGRRRAESADQASAVEVPAIIDQALWDDVQKAMQRRQTRRKSRLPGDDPWLLRGLLTCGHCGGALSVVNNWSTSTGTYRQYRCLRSERSFALRRDMPVCEMRDIRAEHIETTVWGMVREALLDPQRLRAGLDSAQTEYAQAVKSRTERRDGLERELARQRNLIGRILDEILETPKGTQSYRDLVERQRRAEDTFRQLENQRASLDTVPEVGLSPAAASQLEQFAVEVASGLEVATTSERRWVLDRLRLTGTVRLDPNGVRFGRIHHRFSLELNACIRLQAGHDTTWSFTSPADCMKA